MQVRGSIVFFLCCLDDADKVYDNVAGLPHPPTLGTTPLTLHQTGNIVVDWPHPSTLNSGRYTLNLKPQTLNPQPSILNPEHYTLQLLYKPQNLKP